MNISIFDNKWGVDQNITDAMEDIMDLLPSDGYEKVVVYDRMLQEGLAKYFDGDEVELILVVSADGEISSFRDEDDGDFFDEMILIPLVDDMKLELSGVSTTMTVGLCYMFDITDRGNYIISSIGDSSVLIAHRADKPALVL